MSTDRPDVEPVGPAQPERLRAAIRSDRALVTAAGFTLGSRIFARFAQLLLLVLVARLLSVEEFAAYSYIVVLALTFSLFADTGVPLVASREIASGREDVRATFWSSAPVIACGAAIAGAALLAFGLLDSGPGTGGGPLLLAAAYAAIVTLVNACMVTMRGLGMAAAEAWLQGGGAFATVAVGALVMSLAGSVEAILLVLVAKEVASLVIAGALIAPSVGLPMRPLAGRWRRLLRAGIYLSLASTALILTTRLPLVLLGNTSSKEAVAWFSAPLRITDAMILFGITGGYALFPGLSALHVEAPARSRRLLARVLAIAGAGSLVLAALFVVLADPLLTLVFGEAFSESVPSARILFLGIPAYTLLGVAWYALLAAGRERHLLALGAGALALSLAVGLALVPSHDEVGAAWAYLVGVAALCVAVVWSVSRGARA